MRIPRIYIDQSLSINKSVSLPKETVVYLNTVLRRKSGNQIILFNNQLDGNNQYGEYTADIINQPNNKNSKYHLDIHITSYRALTNNNPDTKNIELAQCISKPAHFDLTLQKSVELGVNTLTPISSQRSEQSHKDSNKQQQRWQKIIISACEQSGRCDLANLAQTTSLSEWLNNNQQPETLLIALCTKTKTKLSTLLQDKTLDKYSSIKVIIGPEGGFDGTELELFKRKNVQLVKLGPTILRTETAGIAVMSILQFWCCW